MKSLFALLFLASTAQSAPSPAPALKPSPIVAAAATTKKVDGKNVAVKAVATSQKSLQARLKEVTEKNPGRSSDSMVFDLPVTYNRNVSKWVTYFQSRGGRWFREWLERSTRYMPYLQEELKKNGLPTDLAFMVMIESGFSFHAVSVADAVGPWQFIEPTGTRYGLSKTWWLDERRDLHKSTRAAIRYMKDLYAEFGSWYLVAASYNMGENGLRRRIASAGTKDYWELVHKGALPLETQEYVPKILAAMLISKAPNLYGFRNVERLDIFDVDIVKVPGGTDLNKLADSLGVTRKSLKDMNAELLLGYIPRQVEEHKIRVPRGAGRLCADYVREQTRTIN